MASKGDGGTFAKRFAECAVAMRNMLYEGGTFSEAELHFIDNHFRVLEMAYFRWKQKRTPLVSTALSDTTRRKAA
jgi:hypothetical protein